MTPEVKERIEQIRHGNVPEGYKKTKVGIFPFEWDLCRLDQLLEFKNGINADKEKFGQGTKLISVRDILANRPITYDSIRGSVDVNEQQLEEFGVKYGDILFQRSSENYEDVGTSNVYLDPDNTAVFSGFVIRGKKIAEYDPVYLNSLLYVSYVRKEIIRQAAGAQHINIGQDSLARICIALASDKEQQKIAEILTTQDKVIELEQQKIEEIKKVKKFFLSKMFPKKGQAVPEIRFKGFTDAWEQRKLGEMASLITKGTTPLNKSNTGEVNFVKIESIDEASGEISITQKITNEEHEGYLRRSQLKENDILFSIAGTLGRVTSVESSILPANTNQALAIIRLKNGDLQYVKTYLKGKAVSDYIKKNPTIGAQPNLSLEQVGSIEIALPSVQEQRIIGDYFRQIDNLITLHQRKLEEEKQKKKALMQLLLMGIVRV